MNDRAAAESNRKDAQETSLKVRQDIKASSFEKSFWEPVQYGELLGFIIDLFSGKFIVPDRRVATFKDMLQHVLDCQFFVSAHHIVRLTGSLSSMGLALGPVVRLWTRELYQSVQESSSSDKKFQLAE